MNDLTFDRNRYHWTNEQTNLAFANNNAIYKVEFISIDMYDV